MQHRIVLKQVYNLQPRGDEYRILVERLWPYGLKRDDLQCNYWAKEIAPSIYINMPYKELLLFEREYRDELDANPGKVFFIGLVKKALLKTDVWFLFSSKEFLCNHAIILLDWTLNRISNNNSSLVG